MKKIVLPCFIFSLATLLSFSTLFGENCSEEDNTIFYATANFLNLDDTLRFSLDDCSDRAEVCLGINLDDISNYQVTTNGQPYSNGIAGCDFDTTNVYSYANLFGQGALGPYILQSWDVNGSNFTTNFNSIQELVDSMNIWDPTGNWVDDAANALISGGTPGIAYQDMIVWVVIINAPNTIGHNIIFDPLGTQVNFGVGANEVIVTDNLSGQSDTVLVLAGCMQPATSNEAVLVGENDNTCLDFSELAGDVASVTNICTNTNVNFLLTNGDSCVQFTGLSFGLDTACLVACDIYDFCDTTYVIVESRLATGSQDSVITIIEGQSGQWCIDPAVFAGTPDTIYNICENSAGTYVSFVLDETNLCVDYTGILYGGQDSACIVVCDELDNCDTTNFFITINRDGPAFFFDTLYPNQSNVFCDFDIANLEGNLTTIENGCAGQSGIEVFFDVDVVAFCVDYEGMMVGKDTACIYLTDDQGVVDTTFMIVCVLPPTSDTLRETIRLTVTPEYCIDTLQLGGTITSIENICPDASSSVVNFVIDETTWCVTAEPINLGIDTACIVICDEFDICDTTTIIITVDDEPIMGPPEAVNDLDTTAQNNSFVFDVCANDFVPVNSPMTNFFLLPPSAGGVGPSNGVAFSNPDCTISYTPGENYCGADSMTYVVCNAAACDTAVAVVWVDCPFGQEFKIFNAFSPNGDQVNDYFRITGIERYPNHTLQVYSRWGLLVLETMDYQNDWDGTWEGLDVPDGTYFYVLDTGDGEMLSGYVFIAR